MENFNKFRGKTALVTDASGGNGGAVPKTFARLGARVITHYHSQKGSRGRCAG